MFLSFNLTWACATIRHQRQILTEQPVEQGNRASVVLEAFNVIPSVTVQDGNTGRSAVITSGVSLSETLHTPVHPVHNLPQAEVNTFFTNGVQNEKVEEEEKEKKSREAEELYGTAVYFASPEDVRQETEEERETRKVGTDPTTQP
ncbi:hypothetical protein AGDE_16656 [Angomonas deanei]|nr:hypothetical protein AGDE_16656 [Angomonas deanei]|eukprot:EPY16689.1 hypothetical protein AGDE_16656 [Angomonas deanei]